MKPATDLYATSLLHHAKSIQKFPRLENPHYTIHKQAKFCGSEISIDVNYEQDKISQFGMEISACAIGTATASVISKNIIGLSKAEIQNLHKNLHMLLEEKTEIPIDKWQELEFLKTVAEYPHRHASALLIIDALYETLK